MCFLVLFVPSSQRKRKGRDVRPSMVTQTLNFCSAVSSGQMRVHARTCTRTRTRTHTHTHTHTHTSGHPFVLWQPGSSWGFSVLLKGLTSEIVLRVERLLNIHSYHLQPLPDLRLEPATFGLQVRYSIHYCFSFSFVFQDFVSWIL